jgi:hypothetical protein
MSNHYVRTLRTQSSERFLIQTDKDRDVAALDLHYLADNRVVGTLIVLDAAAIPEAKIPEVLRDVDERLLPDASIEDGKVMFTVVVGHVVGTFFPQETPDVKA